MLFISLAAACLCSAASGDQPAAADSASLLQKPLFSVDSTDNATEELPHIIGLRRESVPIYRLGKIASFKTSYSGVVTVGNPPQDFRVVFDTGSAHLVLPAVECKSEACTANNRRLYDMKASHSSLPINADGSIVHEGDMGEQVTIGFGTGEITGEFAKDSVCFGKQQTKDEKELAVLEEQQDAEIAALIKQESLNIHLVDNSTISPLTQWEQRPEDGDAEPMCVEMNVIVAVEMSTVPFKTFQFDGILGLSLDGLAMNKNFSMFDMLVRNNLAAKPIFGVFLTDKEDIEPSEVAFGGADPKRMLEPVSWTDVYMPELGYWIVPITGVFVDGVEQEFCKDGTCKGVVDTGTSHLGIPAPHKQELEDMLQVDAGDLLDCRLAKSPTLEITLPGKTIKLTAASYMRRLPLRDGVSVSSATGVTLDDDKEKQKEKARRPGYEEIIIGNNTVGAVEKCVKPTLPVACDPEAANRRNDVYTDSFVVVEKWGEICVRRTDQAGAWGVELAFHCPTRETEMKLRPRLPGEEAIYIGDHWGSDQKKCVRPPVKVDCDADAANNRTDAHQDKFNVSMEEGDVCVTRTDRPGTWGLDLVIRCKHTDGPNIAPDTKALVIGDNWGESGEKCVLPEAPLVCDPDAANRRNDDFDDRFLVFAKDNQICVKRTDGQSAATTWGINLVIYCQLADAVQVSAADGQASTERDEIHLQQQQPASAPAPTQQGDSEGSGSNAQGEESEVVKRHCSPRLLSVKLPEPLGPKLFILGEPVLHHYYTVYDWEQKRVGFSLANTQRNTMDWSTLGRGTLPKEVDMLLMQRDTTVTRPKALP